MKAFVGQWYFASRDVKRTAAWLRRGFGLLMKYLRVVRKVPDALIVLLLSSKT
jgi:hypothetical protein